MPKGLYRSALYVPGDHPGAMAKAHTLDADILIFDLEDGVAPDKKADAREAIANALAENDYSNYTTIVRVNHASTEEHVADVTMVAQSRCDAIMLSKANDINEVKTAARLLAYHGAADRGIWGNIETPLGVANVKSMAMMPIVKGMVVGTNDLANDLRIERTPDRAALMYSLQAVQLACRAHNKPVLDGTFVDLEDMDGLRAETEQGRLLGFDGKTLIHPKQIAIANEVFGPSEQEFEEAREIIALYEREAIDKHKAVCLMGSRMIERLHYNRAKELLSLEDRLKAA